MPFLSSGSSNQSTLDCLTFSCISIYTFYKRDVVEIAERKYFCALSSHDSRIVVLIWSPFVRFDCFTVFL